jgi:hypothetical protein
LGKTVTSDTNAAYNIIDQGDSRFNVFNVHIYYSFLFLSMVESAILQIVDHTFCLCRELEPLFSAALLAFCCLSSSGCGEQAASTASLFQMPCICACTAFPVWSMTSYFE